MPFHSFPAKPAKPSGTRVATASAPPDAFRNGKGANQRGKGAQPDNARGGKGAPKGKGKLTVPGARQKGMPRSTSSPATARPVANKGSNAHQNTNPMTVGKGRDQKSAVKGKGRGEKGTPSAPSASAATNSSRAEEAPQTLARRATHTIDNLEGPRASLYADLSKPLRSDRLNASSRHSFDSLTDHDGPSTETSIQLASEEPTHSHRQSVGKQSRPQSARVLRTRKKAAAIPIVPDARTYANRTVARYVACDALKRATMHPTGQQEEARFVEDVCVDETLRASLDSTSEISGSVGQRRSSSVPPSSGSQSARRLSEDVANHNFAAMRPTSRGVKRFPGNNVCGHVMDQVVFGRNTLHQSGASTARCDTYETMAGASSWNVREQGVKKQPQEAARVDEIVFGGACWSSDGPKIDVTQPVKDEIEPARRKQRYDSSADLHRAERAGRGSWLETDRKRRPAHTIDVADEKGRAAFSVQTSMGILIQGRDTDHVCQKQEEFDVKERAIRPARRRTFHTSRKTERHEPENANVVGPHKLELGVPLDPRHKHHYEGAAGKHSSEPSRAEIGGARGKRPLIDMRSYEGVAGLLSGMIL